MIGDARQTHDRDGRVGSESNMMRMKSMYALLLCGITSGIPAALYFWWLLFASL